MEHHDADYSIDGTRARSERSNTEGQESFTHVNVPLDFINMMMDGEMISGRVDRQAGRPNKAVSPCTVRHQQARNAFYHHENSMVGVKGSADGQARNNAVKPQSSTVRNPRRRVKFADEHEETIIDTSQVIFGSVNREARRRGRAISRAGSLRPSISAPGRIQRTRLAEEARRAARAAELARTSSARRAAESRRKAAGVFGVENLPKNSQDGPAYLPEHAASPFLPPPEKDGYQIWVDERTVKRQGSTKLRQRPACQNHIKSVGVSSRTQAQAGEYLPQTRRTQTTPAEISQIDPTTGALRKRKAHTLRGCGHIIRTKNPTSCAGNCACGISTGRAREDSPAANFEHPCIHCVKERLQHEKFRFEYAKIDVHRSRIAEDILNGSKDLEEGREECARFEKNMGRLWLAEMNLDGQAALIDQLYESGVFSALESEYDVYDMSKPRIPFKAQTNRMSDYRGQERSYDLLNMAVGLKTYASKI